MPGFDDWRYRLKVGSVVGLWFCSLYFLTDLVTLNRTNLASLTTPLDRLIPFWPWFAFAYLSVTPLLCLPLLVLPKRTDIQALAATLMVQIALAALVFLVFPVTGPNPAPTQAPKVFYWADAVNLSYNNFPSLHVALTATTALALRGHLGRVQGLVMLWAAAICVSTLFTWQHTLADVSGGLALAALGHWAIRPRISARLAATPG
ncbi:MAG: phosphatase PAP2 family protein [Paracoccaceae bacterium]